MIDPHTAVIVVTHLLQYMYLPAHEVWYHGAVWSNVFVLAPLALLGTIGYWVHKWVTKDIEKFDHEASHAALHAKLDNLLKQLDPEIETNSILDYIAGQVNEDTPGGLKTLRDEIKELGRGSDRS